MKPFLLGDAMKMIDIAGREFYNLTVLHEHGRNSAGKALWECLCSCGTKFIAEGSRIRFGRTKECHACALETQRKSATKHDMCKHPEYFVLADMKRRCYNKKNNRYARYGGRGIVVCERWLESPLNFIADMGSRPSKNHSIERRNNDGNYEPCNCYWAVREEQANNRSNNTKITIDGVTKNLTQWSSQEGICRTVIYRRLKRGLSGNDLIAKAQ